MTDKSDFQWCLGSATLINCTASPRNSRPHFFKGLVFQNVLQSTKIGSYSSLKGRKAFSTSQKSHCDFFLLFSLMFCFLVQKRQEHWSPSFHYRNWKEKIQPSMSLERNTSSAGSIQKKRTKHRKNTQSPWSVFASVSHTSEELTPPFWNPNLSPLPRICLVSNDLCISTARWISQQSHLSVTTAEIKWQNCIIHWEVF